MQRMFVTPMRRLLFQTVGVPSGVWHAQALMGNFVSNSNQL